MELRVEPRDAIECLAADLDSRHLPRPYRSPDLASALEAHEPSTRGTLNKPALRSAAGAWLNTRSRSSEGTGVSSRRRAALVDADAGATETPDVSTCCTWSA